MGEVHQLLDRLEQAASSVEESSRWAYKNAIHAVRVGLSELPYGDTEE